MYLHIVQTLDVINILRSLCASQSSCTSEDDDDRDNCSAASRLASWETTPPPTTWWAPQSSTHTSLSPRLSATDKNCSYPRHCTPVHLLLLYQSRFDPSVLLLFQNLSPFSSFLSHFHWESAQGLATNLSRSPGGTDHHLQLGRRQAHSGNTWPTHLICRLCQWRKKNARRSRAQNLGPGR
jgi:hypothetical protein